MDPDKTEPKQNRDKTHAGRRLTASDTLLLRSLAYKLGYFSRKGQLAADGSFFYDDGRLALENGVTAKTVMRSKRRLQEKGKIRFEPGRHRGRATRYWVLAKDDFLSSFPSNPEPDILSAKHDNLSAKAGHGVIPNNLIIKKIDSFQKTEMTDAQEKERRAAFRECIQNLKKRHGVGTKTRVKEFG